MKLIHAAMLALAISATAVSTAQARDSYTIGVNVGGFGYAPPVAYHPAPVYYAEPIVYHRPVRYYQPAPRYYGYAPNVVSFGYQSFGGGHFRDFDRRHFRGGDRHHGRWQGRDHDRGHDRNRGRDRGWR